MRDPRYNLHRCFPYYLSTRSRRAAQAARFWAKVRTRRADSLKCWEWLGARTFQLDDTRLSCPARVAFALTYGEPTGRVQRSCGTPTCVRPDHLHTVRHDGGEDPGAESRGHADVRRGARAQPGADRRLPVPEGGEGGSTTEEGSGMTTSEREERRLAFYRAAAWIAKEKHGKQFSELSPSDGAAVVGEVYRPASRIAERVRRARRGRGHGRAAAAVWRCRLRRCGLRRAPWPSATASPPPTSRPIR